MLEILSNFTFLLKTLNEYQAVYYLNTFLILFRLVYYQFSENIVTKAHTVTISPKAIICELQPVTVTEEVFNNILESEERKEYIRSLEFGSKRNFNRGRERKIEMSPSQTCRHILKT